MSNKNNTHGLLRVRLDPWSFDAIQLVHYVNIPSPWPLSLIRYEDQLPIYRRVSSYGPIKESWTVHAVSCSRVR